MEAITLQNLLSRVAALVQQAETQNVWVVAELSDVAVRGGHCYMELLQKDAAGNQLAKARGIIWASTYASLSADFFAATGQRFETGLKVMLQVSATMSPIYGFSLLVSAVNPEYTLGDLIARRNEILRRLQQEGILELNRSLRWPVVPQRIAVVSAKGAAGYGDFLNQLYTNPNHIRFTTTLFPAIMQGTKAPASIIGALDRVAERLDEFDGVVIIRGGGATSDLQAYEDYDLAATVAQFPLPVAIGIGHERDVTVLDWVANARLKTPTAVAEWLIAGGERLLGYLQQTTRKILQTATDRMAGSKEQIAHALGLLPIAATAALDRQKARLRNAAASLQGVSGRRIAPEQTRLDLRLQAITTAAQNQLRRRADRLDALQTLLKALSPEATLLRGYSITRVNGHAITSPQGLQPGTPIETTLAGGLLHSKSME